VAAASAPDFVSPEHVSKLLADATLGVKPKYDDGPADPDTAELVRWQE
jgi:hypothetical protein